MEKSTTTTQRNEYWKCEKCGKVLSGHFDGDEYRTKTINGQEIVIKDFGTAKLEAICQNCGYENVFDGKKFYTNNDSDAIYGLYPELE